MNRVSAHNQRLIELDLGVGLYRGITFAVKHRPQGVPNMIEHQIRPHAASTFLDHDMGSRKEQFFLRHVLINITAGYWLLSLYADVQSSDDALVAAATAALVMRTIQDGRLIREAMLTAAHGAIQALPRGWNDKEARQALEPLRNGSGL